MVRAGQRAGERTIAFRLTLSARAERELGDIWRYTSERWDSTQADRYLALLHDAITALPFRTRDAGRSFPAGRGYERQRVQSHCIWYRIEGSELHIIAVRHARMRSLSQLH